MKRRHKSTSGTVPAFFCLIFATMLLIVSKAGGNDVLKNIIKNIAQNEHFIRAALAIETGKYTIDTISTKQHENNENYEEEISPHEEIINQNINQNLPQNITDNNSPKNQTVLFNNQSGLQFDLENMLANPKRITANSTDKPLVLIYHTHATEAFTQSNENKYEPSGEQRTLDKTQNVVRLGTELCKILEKRGIKTIHLTDLHDYPSYNGSYGASLKNVSAVLKKHPSIKIAIDIHRDAIINPDGSLKKLTSEQNGKTAAKMMLVMGTNASGLQFDDWQEHLAYAVTLQSEIDTMHPNLMRPINLRKQRFNLHLSPASMLLEVGTSGNTLEEALYSINLFGNALASFMNAPQ